MLRGSSLSCSTRCEVFGLPVHTLIYESQSTVLRLGQLYVDRQFRHCSFCCIFIKSQDRFLDRILPEKMRLNSVWSDGLFRSALFDLEWPFRVNHDNNKILILRMILGGKNYLIWKAWGLSDDEMLCDIYRVDDALLVVRLSTRSGSGSVSWGEYIETATDGDYHFIEHKYNETIFTVRRIRL